jgi:hypothetical protein
MIESRHNSKDVVPVLWMLLPKTIMCSVIDSSSLHVADCCIVNGVSPVSVVAPHIAIIAFIFVVFFSVKFDCQVVIATIAALPPVMPSFSRLPPFLLQRLLSHLPPPPSYRHTHHLPDHRRLFLTISYG